MREPCVQKCELDRDIIFLARLLTTTPLHCCTSMEGKGNGYHLQPSVLLIGGTKISSYLLS